MMRKLGFAGVIAVLLSLVFAGLALALSITVDGDHGTDEWGVGNSETCTIGDPGCTRIVDDPIDVVGPDAPAYDVANLHATNSATTMYFSVDMYGVTPSPDGTWDVTAGGRPLFTICLDIDNNLATGGTRVAGNCNGGQAMSGVDFYITIVADELNAGFPMVPSVRSWNGTTFVANGTGTVGYDLDADGFTEIGIPMANLGYTGNGLCPISNGPQPCAARMASYYDNGAAPSDDSVPDTGTFTFLFGCNLGGTPCSPTAITLNSLQAQPSTSPVVPVALIGVSAAALIGVVFFIRRRKTA